MRARYLAAAAAAIFAMASQAGGISREVELSRDFHTGDRFMGIRMLGALQLGSGAGNGIVMSELSGLAWDEDEQLLYAVSDSGKLFHLLPRFSHDRLVGVEMAAAFELLDAAGAPLRDRAADSEDLAIEYGNDGVRGNSRLLVSFERQPRILRFDTRGVPAGAVALPAMLRRPGAYRTPNKGLEALVLHPGRGLLTGAEYPLSAADDGYFSIYNQAGEEWKISRHDRHASGLVAMEAMPDGDLLVMQRTFRFALFPPVILLQRLRINNMPPGTLLAGETVATFDNGAGWMVDNFEGLTRHQGNRYFMVSDDNESFLQRTLLFYFEVLENP